MNYSEENKKTSSEKTLNFLKKALNESHIDRTSSSWWQTRQQDILNTFKTENTPVGLIRKIQLNPISGFDHRISSENCDEVERINLFKFLTLKKRHAGFYEAIKKCSESDASIPSSLVDIEGFKVSNIFLSHLGSFLKIRKYLDEGINTVAEIGGGYGSLARIFLNCVRPKYIIIDMPLSLSCAAIYLLENKPDLKLYLDIQSSCENNLKNIFQEYDVLLLEPTNANFEKLSKIKIDLIINTGSLQEMPDERSKYFQDQIFHKMDSKAVFFCNYFLNPNELGGLGSERNMEAKPIVPSFSSDWKIVYAKINELLWCIDASERNWLEILLIKNPKSFLKGKKRRIYEKLEIICNNQKISLAEYLNAYKFILEFFENVIGNGTSKKSNRNNLVGLVWKNENKDVLKNNFFTKPFVLARWFSSQFPEISHMKRRLKIRNNLWVFVNEIFLITKDFFQKFSFLKSKVNKSKNIFRIHRKGLPSIDTFSETLINKRKITKN